MKTLLTSTLLGALLVGSAWGYQKAVAKRSTFVDETHGFTMEIPHFPGAGAKATSMVALFSGPVSEGTAPNVNVSVQGVATTAQAYQERSRAEFEQLGLKINASKLVKLQGRDAVELDYEGILQNNKSVRFLALAIIEKERIVQITCMTSAESFKALEPEFRATLDSFKLR